MNMCRMMSSKHGSKKTIRLRPHEHRPHEQSYIALGNTDETRRAANCALFKYQLDDAEITEIRTSLNKGLAVGTERFKDQIETVLARSVRPGQAGRKKMACGLHGKQENLRFKEEAK